MTPHTKAVLDEFREIGFGNQARFPSVHAYKRVELEDFLREKLEQAYEEGKRDSNYHCCCCCKKHKNPYEPPYEITC